MNMRTILEHPQGEILRTWDICAVYLHTMSIAQELALSGI